VVAVDAVTRARLADLGAIAFAVAYGTFFVVMGDATAGPGTALPWQVDVGVGLVCCATLWWRRRHPLALAVALVPFGAVSVMATAAVMVAVYTVAARRPSWVPAAALGLAQVATAPVYVAMQERPAYPLWVDLVVRTVVGSAALGWGMFARAQRQVVESLTERAARAEADQHLRADRARVAERTRIARDMHDVLADRIVELSVRAEALQLSADTDADPHATAAAAGAVRLGAHEALEELREVIGLLRDVPGAPTS
jgi:signal transduction histidine kinase